MPAVTFQCEGRSFVVLQATPHLDGGRILQECSASAQGLSLVFAAMQMDVQVGGRAESLDEGDRAGVGRGPFLPTRKMINLME